MAERKRTEGRTPHEGSGLLVACAAALVVACAGLTTVAGSSLYLGQVPPGTAVEVFAPDVVSIPEGKEYKISFSPDLTEVLFTRRTPRGRNDRIWLARMDGETLGIPELAPFAYDALEMDPSFAPDGRRVFFNSRRPVPGQTNVSSQFNVWVVERTETGWGEPSLVGSPLNDYRPVYFSFAQDGTMYFTRTSPREIWYSEPSGNGYGEARRLSSGVNSLVNVAHPAISPDESYIVVDSYSEAAGVLRGSLFVSFRREDGSWSDAVSLAESLAASSTDIYASPRVTPDGKYLFFERFVASTDTSDICWVSTEVIHSLALGDD